MKKTEHSYAILAILFLSPIFAMAQTNDTLELERNDKGIISFLKVKSNYTRTISKGTEFLRQALQQTANDEFKLTSQVNDELGFSHSRYQQYFKGIKVEGGEYLIHGRNGLIETVNGNYLIVDIPAEKASVSESQALTTRLRLVRSAKNEALCCTEPSAAGLFIMGIEWEVQFGLCAARIR